MQTLGEIAYNSYCEQTDWKSLVSGQELPKFEVLKEEIREAWEASANGIKKHLDNLPVSVMIKTVESSHGKVISPVCIVSEGTEASGEFSVIELHKV